MGYRQIEKLLRSLGCTEVSQSGSHVKWQCGTCGTSVPKHREVTPGTLRNIQRDLAPCLGDKWLEGK